MKYEINRFNNSEVIQCYAKSDELIIVVYLDNHAKEIPYTKENETKVINEMIMQAMVREEIEINRLPIELKNEIQFLIMYALTSSYMVYNLKAHSEYFVYKSDLFKLIYSVILALSSGNIVKSLSKIINNYKINKDIMKYHEFFEMKDEIEKYGDVIVVEDIPLKEILNINTLDFYSISRVKEILEIVKENYNEGKTLIKK